MFEGWGDGREVEEPGAKKCGCRVGSGRSALVGRSTGCVVGIGETFAVSEIDVIDAWPCAGAHPAFSIRIPDAGAVIFTLFEFATLVHPFLRGNYDNISETKN